MVLNFNDFLSNVILEELHPEIKNIVTSKTTNKAKQTQLAKKIKELSDKGEKTGIEGNMPKGSSRAYLKHDEPEEINIDGNKHHIRVGTKVAIRAALDKHHNKNEHDGLSLGQLQNRAENSDHWVNSSYRVLSKDDKGNYHTNHHSGIFPPLLDHDDNHEYSKVGHARDIKSKEFEHLTKTESHPKGISHKDFTQAMNRFHERNNGKYWERDKEHERHLDHIDEHPLVQKFQDYHGNTNHPPYDYQQKRNMGVFEHPDGTKHIVARDHGFDTDVQKAYTKARKNQIRGI